MKIGNLEINLEELANFLVEAKKACWAGSGEEELMMGGSKLLTFQKGNFHYIDNYAGYFQIAGNELVRWRDFDGQRIWQMNYSGGMLPEFQGDKKLAKETNDFLREMLSRVSIRKPFRGLESPVSDSVEDENFRYFTKTEGDIERFCGEESIFSFQKNSKVYSLNYHGGIIIPK